MIINPYLVQPSGPSYDPDAQSFFTATGITDNTQMNAINQFVLDLKSNSLWTKGKYMYLGFLGDSTKCKYNLFNTTETLTFNGGWTFDSVGMQGNGINAYANTNIPFTTYITSATSVTGGAYIQTNTASGADFGVSDGASFSKGITLFSRADATTTYYSVSDLITNGTVGTSVNTQAHFTIFRNDNSTKYIYRNGTQIGTYSGSANTLGALYTTFLSARNIDNSALSYSSRKYSAQYLFDGFTTTQAGNLHTCINTMMTTLGINV